MSICHSTNDLPSDPIDGRPLRSAAVIARSKISPPVPYAIVTANLSSNIPAVDTCTLPFVTDRPLAALHVGLVLPDSENEEVSEAGAGYHNSALPK